MFSSLCTCSACSACSANTKTVIFLTICVFIGNAHANSANDSTIITTDNDTEQFRRSNLLYQVRLPPEDAKQVYKVLRLSDRENKNLVHENKTIQLKVPVKFLDLKAFKHALVKKVSEYTVQASKKPLKFKVLYKTTKKIKVLYKTTKQTFRQNAATVKRNGKSPQRHNTPKKSVKKLKLRSKSDNKTQSGRSQTAPKHPKNPIRSNPTKDPTITPIHKRVKKISTKSVKQNVRRPKFKSIISGKSDKESKKAKRNSTNEPKSPNITKAALKPSPIKKVVTIKVATYLQESSTTGATEKTTPTRAETKDTTLSESTTTKAPLRSDKLEESPAVEETTVTGSAPVTTSSSVGESSTAEESTLALESTLQEESTPKEESTPREESTAAEETTLEETTPKETTPEETTPEESTTEETTTTRRTKATTTIRLPLARPLVFMGPKEN